MFRTKKGNIFSKPIIQDVQLLVSLLAVSLREQTPIKYSWTLPFPPTMKLSHSPAAFGSLQNASDDGWPSCYSKLWINILCLFSFEWSPLFPQANESWFYLPHQVGHFYFDAFYPKGKEILYTLAYFKMHMPSSASLTER